jgi:hypothetical protein
LARARAAPFRCAPAVGRGFLLCGLVVLQTLAGEILPIFGLGETHRGNVSCNRVRLIHLQFAAEELGEHRAAVLQEPPVPFGKQTAHQRRGCVINLERPFDDEAAGSQVGPAASIEVGILDLVLGIDAALTLALQA